ncbi:MAG: hypothetical protein A2X49_01255 [Lentisphaerae bacterium GWF2_52_8]|nr:MAG: hypothetical protein A2X49_01255 [Lentisphaerae bacterium GWF2_52_8]
MNELLPLSGYAAKAIGTVLLVAFAGAFLVRKKILSDESLAILSKLVFAMMLPCLLFSKVARTVNLEMLQTHWILPLSCVLFVLAGLFLGWLMGLLCRVETRFHPLLMVASSFGNASYIPIPLLAAVTLSFPVFAGRPDAQAAGVSYISIFLIIYSPLLWTLGYKLLTGGQNRGSRRLFDVLTPPIIGMALGVLVGLIPFLRALFCVKTGVFSPILEAADILGMAAVPCALIVLGGKLAHGPGRGSFNKRTILGVLSVKLVLLPLLAIGGLLLLSRVNLLPLDTICILVLVLEAASPPATNLAVICALGRNKEIEDNMASLLFWSYLAAIPSLAIVLVFTMWLFC